MNVHYMMATVTTIIMMFMLCMLLGCSEKKVYSAVWNDKFVDIGNEEITIRLVSEKSNDVWRLDQEKTDKTLRVIGTVIGGRKDYNYQEWTIGKRWYPEGGGDVTIKRFKQINGKDCPVDTFTLHILVTRPRSLR